MGSSGGHSSSMESQDQYRYPRIPDYEPRLWAQFDNTNFPRQENGENPQIKGTPAKQTNGKHKKQPPELGQHTAHSQSEMKVDKTKTTGRTKKKEKKKNKREKKKKKKKKKKK